MSFLSFDSALAWGMLPSLAAHLAAGIGLGVVYFRAVWWTVRLFASGGRMTTAVALTVGRLVFLGGLLALASLEGAAPLLVTALGVMVGRFAVMHRLREAAP